MKEIVNQKVNAPDSSPTNYQLIVLNQFKLIVQELVQ